MTEAPERIWRWAVPNSGGFIEYAEDYPIKSPSAAEYVRADKVQALVEALDWIAVLAPDHRHNGNRNDLIACNAVGHARTALAAFTDGGAQG